MERVRKSSIPGISIQKYLLSGYCSDGWNLRKRRKWSQEEVGRQDRWKCRAPHVLQEADASPIIHLFHRGLLNTYYVSYNGQKTDMLPAPVDLTNQQNVKQSRAREPGRLQEKAKKKLLFFFFECLYSSQLIPTQTTKDIIIITVLIVEETRGQKIQAIAPNYC